MRRGQQPEARIPSMTEMEDTMLAQELQMQSIQQGDTIEQDNLNSDSARSANTGRSRDEQLGSIPDPHEHAQSQLQHRNSQPRNQTTPTASVQECLSMFFRCKGQKFGADTKIATSCSVRNKTFGDVVTNVDESLRSLRFTSVFDLARLLSIYLQTTWDKDQRKYLMKRQDYLFLSAHGVGLAFTYFKSTCEHVLFAVLQYDGDFQFVHTPKVETNINELAESNNMGLAFTKGKVWSEVKNAVESPQETKMMLAPDGFRNIWTIFERDADLVVRTYRSLEDASRTLSTPEQYAAIIWVGPTKEQNEGEAEWLEIVASLGKHLKAGSRIVGVSPPRGEENWKEARRMQAEAVRLLKQSVQIAADNVISKIPQDLVPVFDEPFAALAASSRSRNNDAYHTEAVKGYYRALQDNLSADVKLPNLVLKSRSSDRIYHQRGRGTRPYRARNVSRWRGAHTDPPWQDRNRWTREKQQ